MIVFYACKEFIWGILWNAALICDIDLVVPNKINFLKKLLTIFFTWRNIVDVNDNKI